jgi:uncharacterized protein (UPF0548 family)
VRKARGRRRLAQLREAPLNFDPADLDRPGWHVDERIEPLPSERPGEPEPRGAWEIARNLMQGYGFADPSIVRAEYDPRSPLEGRTMLLEVRFLGLHIFAGVRVADVYERIELIAGREALVWGWNYRTLAGHFEQGEMDWQVVKWQESGEVAFRIRARSRHSSDPSPLIRVGLRLFGRREQLRFYQRTSMRMRRLTEKALSA